MLKGNFFLTGKYHDDEEGGDHITFTAKFGPFKASFKVYMPNEGEDTCDVECMPGLKHDRRSMPNGPTPQETTSA